MYEYGMSRGRKEGRKESEGVSGGVGSLSREGRKVDSVDMRKGG